MRPAAMFSFIAGRMRSSSYSTRQATVRSDMKLGVPTHGAAGPGHVTFSIRETEMAAWRERLSAEGVAIEKEVDWPGGGRSIYFRDPAGNSVELASARIWRLEEPS